MEADWTIGPSPPKSKREAAPHGLHPRRQGPQNPATGAETQVFTVARRNRNQPLPLDEALELELAADPRARLLVNARPGRAAVQTPAPNLMLDDGEIERRVRLVRPMERTAIGLDALGHAEWQETERDAFAAAWQGEVASVPEFATSRFHIVTGLLLPIWTRLPSESCRVYRLQTDGGERVIGRLVSPAWIAQCGRRRGAILVGRQRLGRTDGWPDYS